MLPDCIVVELNGRKGRGPERWSFKAKMQIVLV